MTGVGVRLEATPDEVLVPTLDDATPVDQVVVVVELDARDVNLDPLDGFSGLDTNVPDADRGTGQGFSNVECFQDSILHDPSSHVDHRVT